MQRKVAAVLIDSAGDAATSVDGIFEVIVGCHVGMWREDARRRSGVDVVKLKKECPPATTQRPCFGIVEARSSLG